MRSKQILTICGVTIAVAAIALAVGCGSSSSNPSPVPPHLAFNVPVPNVSLAKSSNFGFDIGGISGATYFLSDRLNASLDLVNIPTLGLTQVKPTGANAYAGQTSSNATSGPDGSNAVGSLIYTGDVNSVKIIDPVAGTLVNNIVVSTTGVRADEACLDATHNLYMISSPEEVPPFATFINTQTQTIVAKVTFTDLAGAPSAGLEACQYDAASDTFFVNNDGTTANPHGELNSFSGVDIRKIAAGATVNYTTLPSVKMYGEGNCDPTGLALGPGTDIAVGCREGTTAAPLLFLIFNRSTGALLASLNAGGGDQVWYDPPTNRYYNAASRWTTSGLAASAGTCSSSSPCAPVLWIIDASSRTAVLSLAAGNNAHSVAVDPSSGLVFMPYSSSAAPAGCGTCTANGFTDGGISVYATH
jgi:hypothetical protein